MNKEPSTVYLVRIFVNGSDFIHCDWYETRQEALEEGCSLCRIYNKSHFEVEEYARVTNN